MAFDRARLPSIAATAASLAVLTVTHRLQADTHRFFDGPREVMAERLGAPAADARGRLLTPVRLSYADGRSVVAHVDGSAIVKLDDAGAATTLASAGARLVRPLAPSIGLWLVENDGHGDALDLTDRLAALPAVIDVVPNLYLPVKAKADPYTPKDPRFGGQWYFHNIDMPGAWGITRGDSSTTIVVIDTGCDLEHPDLVSKMDPGLDVVDGDDDPSPVVSESGAAHGTECAGLVGAATDNGEGIAGGCPECRVRCVRFLSDTGSPLSADIEAFQFALDVDADVVSNSWGFVNPMPVPQALAEIIAEVATNGRGGKGALVLFAAGNDDRVLGDDEIENAEGVFCVGAINNFDESTPFTNRGNAIDVVAPTGTLTTDISGPAGSDPTDYTTVFGGTSSACPVAAGLAGLLASAAPDKTSAELYEIMIRTAKPAPFAEPDANGHDDVYGYGIIQPKAALEDALGLTGDGGGGSASSSSGSGGGADGGTDESGDDGCGCSTPGGAGTASAIYLAFGLLVFARRRRA